MRQVHDIVKDFRESDIQELKLGDAWKAQQFAEEHLLRLEEAINAIKQIELGARAQNNISLELGALSRRIKLESEQRKFLQETGLMSAPRNLTFEAEVGRFWHVVNTVFHEYGVSAEIRVAINTALSSVPGAEQGPPPPHWLRSTQELRAAAQKEREAAEQETAQAELLRESCARREAEVEQQRLQEGVEYREREAERIRKQILQGERYRHEQGEKHNGKPSITKRRPTPLPANPFHRGA